MVFQGKSITIEKIGAGFLELRFDLEGESVNKFNRQTIDELQQAVQRLSEQRDLKGLVITSAKEAFIVGADITMFHDVFELPDEEIIALNMAMNATFSRLEDLPCPTVVAINGLALGGGFELSLAVDYRVMAEDAKIGLPEVKLGIFPGWGGTVRLPRLVGADNAMEWICTGNDKTAEQALFVGAVDVVQPKSRLRDAAIDLLVQCQADEHSRPKLDYLRRREAKKSPLKLGQLDSLMAFETAKAMVAAKAGPHYPAPIAAIKCIQKQANLDRDQALLVEAKAFVKMAKTDICHNLVGVFLGDQWVKKTASAYVSQAAETAHAAVLGAGIMGGGIAYQSARRKVPILMKDIHSSALEKGLDEAATLFAKAVERGRMNTAEVASALNRIRATQSYGDFEQVDLVIEAVVEHPKVKSAVLKEVEQQVSDSCIITSNTSTISITTLAESLQRPENFCGMHFFNPVHRMPLVEVIRGKKSSERAVASTVAYANALGKTPIVVNDCPGFLVNRVLFPYLSGFSKLLATGTDIERIDKVMEGFGWPMGPAYLLDVVGLDTVLHAHKVMSQGYPDRMSEGSDAINELVTLGRLGQKTDLGFYQYKLDKKGKLKKTSDPNLSALLARVVTDAQQLTDEDIINYMMIPLCIETSRCVEEGIVASAAEADMGLIYGIGFPPFRGGALRYVDSFGLSGFIQITDDYLHLGPLYQPTERMNAMASNGQTFYPNLSQRSNQG